MVSFWLLRAHRKHRHRRIRYRNSSRLPDANYFHRSDSGADSAQLSTSLVVARLAVVIVCLWFRRSQNRFLFR